MIKLFSIVCLLFYCIGVCFAQVYAGDKSRFVKDETYPDGAKARCGEKINKKWLIKNIGQVSWKHRYISRNGDPQKGVKSEKWTPIIDTKPGQECLVVTDLTIPDEPGDLRAEWKIVELRDTEGGRVFHEDFRKMKPEDRQKLKEVILFPGKDPLYIEITAVKGNPRDLM